MSDVKQKPDTPLPWETNYDSVNRAWRVIPTAWGYGSVAEVWTLGNAAFIAHACTNYQFLVRALKAELREHEQLTREAASEYHRERANNIKALLKSIGEL